MAEWAEVPLLWGILCLVALAAGWAAGRHERRPAAAARDLPPDYYKGVNYLLNEKPDHALDAFLRLTKAHAGTAETLLTLGNLFRRRGEIDHAILVHQDLVARRDTTAIERSQALLELARDYATAGLLDRAENLWLEVIELGVHAAIARPLLRDLYVQQQDWQLAIQVAERIQQLDGVEQATLIAHFHCEIAEQHWQESADADAQRTLELAKQRAPDCPRVHYALTLFAANCGDGEAALAAYATLLALEPRFAVACLPELSRGLRQSMSPKLGRRFADVLAALRRDGIYADDLLMDLRATRGDVEARQYLEAVLIRRPAIEPLMRWLDLLPRRDELAFVRQQLTRLGDRSRPYVCDCCGYHCRRLHWRCPKCLHWGAVYPVT